MEKHQQERYVQLENVNMSFVTKKGIFNALNNISLDIKEGEFISIIAVSYTHLDVYKRQVYLRLHLS